MNTIKQKLILFSKISSILLVLSVFSSTMFSSPLVSKIEAQELQNISVEQDNTLNLSISNEIKNIKEPVAPKAPVAQVVQKPKVSSVPTEQRSAHLQSYLKKRGSYLANHTDLIVSLSDQYGVDYRLIVAISGVESGYCRVNFRPYNCWGYGKIGWSSEEDGIRSYMAKMNSGYFSKGRKTPETIAVIYNPWPDKYIAKVYIHLNQM